MSITLVSYNPDSMSCVCQSVWLRVCCVSSLSLRCFCKDCLDILVAPETFNKLKDIDPWSCFMCDPTQCGGGGHLKRRGHWSTKVQQLFTKNSAFEFVSELSSLPQPLKAVILKYFNFNDPQFEMH